MKTNGSIFLLYALKARSSSAFVQPSAPKTFTSTHRASSLFSAAPANDDNVRTTSDTQVPIAGPGGPLQSGPPEGSSNSIDEPTNSKNAWNKLPTIIVQGNSLRTWSIADPTLERVQIFMKTDGRPLNANLELWEGPDNTPQKMSVYIEDGELRPFSAIIETPRETNAIAIYNTGYLEFPLEACVEVGTPELAGPVEGLYDMGERPKIVQGGAIHTLPFAPSVQSVQIILKTDGRPLNARLELLQGPNNNKQVMEIHTEDGKLRPFVAVFETPGVGNVVRIVNTASVEFPLSAAVKPLVVTPGRDDGMYQSMGQSQGNGPFRY